MRTETLNLKSDVALVGYIERYEGTVFEGWAIDRENENSSIRISMLIDGVLVSEKQTELSRPDVGEAGHPGDRAGFKIQVPISYRDGQPHNYRFYANSSVPLHFLGAPEEVEEIRMAFPAEAGVVSAIDGVLLGMIRGWVVIRNYGTGAVQSALTIIARAGPVELGRFMANLNRPDVASAIGGDGKCGFAFMPPRRLRDGLNYTIDLLVAETMEPLTQSPFTFSYPAPIAQTGHVSCSLQQLYGQGGLYPPELNRTLLGQEAFPAEVVQEIGEVFPRFSYARPDCAKIHSDRPETVKDFVEQIDKIREQYPIGAPSHLFAIRDAYVYNNQIHVIFNGDVITIHESARSNDRPYTKQYYWTEDYLRRDAITVEASRPCLYMGSPGYSNYGHWLTDDLPKLHSLPLIKTRADREHVRLIIPGASHILNARKEESIRLFEPSYTADDLLWISPDQVVHFPELHFVSPFSYHPVLKSPESCSMMVSAIRKTRKGKRDSKKRRIFIARGSSYGRRILNLKQVIGVFAKAGFTMFDIEGHDFYGQAAAFHDAEVIAGCMGAAMTNTVFSPAGTKVLYLIPDGWMEPYYWDLAAACGHPYYALFGKSTDPLVAPHRADFRIDLGKLRETLSHVLQ